MRTNDVFDCFISYLRSLFRPKTMGSKLDWSTVNTRSVLSSQSFGLLLAVCVLIAVVFFPSMQEITTAQQRVLAVFLFALLLWLTKPVPYTVSSLLSVTLLFALGTVDSRLRRPRPDTLQRSFFCCRCCCWATRSQVYNSINSWPGACFPQKVPRGERFDRFRAVYSALRW